jgi:release factor glutamine methyltransferase
MWKGLMSSPVAVLATALQDAQKHLLRVSDTPRLEAEILLAHVLQKPRSYLYTWPEIRLTTSQGQHFETLLTRRCHGEPIAYITGVREFWSLELIITPATLIPRPETERLVELALEQVPLDSPTLVADLGTGSGAIALAIAQERPRVRIVATDNDPAALTVAEGNARRLNVSLELRRGNWCEALDNERFAVIVSNPPYLAGTDPHLQQGDLSFEPPSALIAGADGLDAIRTIIEQALAYLRPSGWLFLEHGYDQAADVSALLRRAGYTSVTIHRDEAGWERVACGQKPVY